ncbi:MAG: hypothetical protein HQL33_06340, partial [Alphaproteobacteria bacterium]|nr:hypothetical protein [Alphaproteobacteria bacterium]
MGRSVSTISPDLPFAETLAAGIVARVGEEPLALSRVTVLLPTVRGCRALRDAFLRLSGGRPMLLPRLAAMGELDEAEVLFADTAAAADLPPEIP